MRQLSLSMGIVAIACGLLANAAPARAAPATWVSGAGANSGSCPVTSPCRTFAVALSQTNAGGTINVLSSGSFGPLTITKSISIVADGVEAAIVGGGSIGAAIKIQAGANAIVSLRGLTIDLRGTVNIGIDFLSGAALHVHNCVIRKSTFGIRFSPASGTSELTVADSVIADTIVNGIHVIPSGSGGANVVLDRVRVKNGGGGGIAFPGVNTTGSITATVRDSVAAGNVNFGIFASEGGGGTTVVTVDRSAAVNNGTTGISAVGAGATIRIGDSTVSGNSIGLSAITSGVIASYGTNKVNGNGTDGAPTNTIAMK